MFFTSIKVSPLIKETVVFKNGKKRLKIKFAIFAEDIIEEYTKNQEKLEKAEKLFKDTGKLKYSQDYGNAAVALIQTIFGEQNADEIFKFYGGRYIQMLADIYPFIESKILPKLQSPFKNIK